MVGRAGFSPTSRIAAALALSYLPVLIMVPVEGLEPPTSADFKRRPVLIVDLFTTLQRSKHTELYRHISQANFFA